MSSGHQMANGRGQRWLDGFAVTASLLCLIHCLMLPALLVALPVLATMLTVPKSVHAIAFALALPTSALAIAAGYRRHRLRWPFVAAASGLALLGVGAFAIDAEIVERAVSSVGALLLALAHVGNWHALSHRAPARPTCPIEEQA